MLVVNESLFERVSLPARRVTQSMALHRCRNGNGRGAKTETESSLPVAKPQRTENVRKQQTKPSSEQEEIRKKIIIDLYRACLVPARVKLHHHHHHEGRCCWSVCFTRRRDFRRAVCLVCQRLKPTQTQHIALHLIPSPKPAQCLYIADGDRARWCVNVGFPAYARPVPSVGE